MNFKYIEPHTLDEVLEIIKKYGNRARLMAGATDLLPQIKNNKIDIEYLVDISKIGALDFISFDHGLRIGPISSIRNLETSSIISGVYSIISKAASQLGSVAIRHVATVGGNLCNASSSAEMSQALMALNAKLKLFRKGGKREISIADFFVGAGKTVIKPEEILTEIMVPQIPAHSGAAYKKYAMRGSIDLAIVNAAVFLTLEGDLETCKEIRISVGAVSDKPMRMLKAEDGLRGKKISIAEAGSIATIAAESVNPREDSVRGSPEYKKEILKVVVRDLIIEAKSQAQNKAK